MVVLPTERLPAKRRNPKFMILFGKPKVGKTTMMSMLDNNLIVDLEGGSEYLSAMSIQARSIKDMGDIVTALKEENEKLGTYKYQFITIDNASRLEDMALPYALRLYKETPMGKHFNGDVRTLPNGAGYFYLRQAVKNVIEMFAELAPHLILIGHTKDRSINVEGEEMTEMSIDLVGKLGDILCGDADAVGYVSRRKNETSISFEGGDNTIKEARADHLRGKRIVVTESDEDNVITAHWDRIYLK
jgi:hypothetical protein